jgi:Fic family protein
MGLGLSVYSLSNRQEEGLINCLKSVKITEGCSNNCVKAQMIKNIDALISLEVVRLIAELDEFKGSWKALRTIAPDRLAALRHVATIESIGSSTRIEGVKLTDLQIESLLSQPLNTQSFKSRDEEEVAGYAALMEVVFESWENIGLTENHIKQLHRTLLKYSYKDERHRGEYKTLPNHVEAFSPDGKSLGIVFETATPFETPYLMSELIDWTRQAVEDQDIHSLLIIAVFVVRFLAIHPFQDGNGRLSRGLTTLLLLRAGYVYVPYSSFESVIEENKESYYLALRRTQGTLQSDQVEWQPWILFFLRSMVRQKARLIEKMDQARLFGADLPELSLRILEMAGQMGRLQMAEIEAATGERRGTIRNRLNELIERGLLARHGKGPATWYTPARSQ